ncbi:MAG: oligosaccharide flippase family protein [Nanoarchaeota archaeon]
MKHPALQKSLLKGSIILLITINLFNLLNFIYNILMARFLTLAEYGALTTLIYFIVIFAVFSESIQAVIARYSTREDNLGKLKNIIKKSFKKATLFSVFSYVIFLLLSIFLTSLLKISYSLLALTGIMIFVSFLIPITRGVLQGKKLFQPFGWNMVLEGGVKLILSFILVSIGFGIYGALLGIIFGSIIALFISKLSLGQIFSAKEKDSETPNIYSYTKPVFMVMLSVVLFLSIDIIFARIFFSPDLVGAYAISSTIAKIIFIGTQPISKAMFPFTSEIKNRVEAKKPFFSSLKLVVLLTFVALLIVYFFPESIVKLYAGRNIFEASSILIYLSLSTSFLAITNMVLFYSLSIGRTRYLPILIIFVAIQAILLSIFNNSLLQFSLALLCSSIIFLLGSILLTRK